MYKLIRDRDEFKELAKFNPDLPIFSDTETCVEEGKSDGGLYGKVRLFQFYQKGMKEALIVDCLFVPLQEVLDHVRDAHLVFHNSSYDLHTLNNTTDGLWLPNRVDDTIYLSRLVFWEKGSKYTFYDCLRYAGLEDDNILAIDKKLNQKADWGGVLTPTMLKYAAYDVLYLSLLWEAVQEAIGTESYELDMFNLKYAIEYSRRGIPVDRDLIREKKRVTIPALEEITETLAPLNFNSPPQCCAFLGTKSSDKDTLVKAKLEGNAKAGLISDARSLVKMVNFLNKYDRDIVKGYYNPSSAITGRWSCTGGDVFDHSNLQQIPHELLACLFALLGKVFIYKDYAGLELRMAVAWICEPVMAEMMRNGVDLHTYTASVIFKVPMSEVTKKQRTIGKICNFLLIYGGGIGRLRAELMDAGILLTFPEVKSIRVAWFNEYPTFNEWHEMVRRAIKVYGYVDITTALGRNIRCYSVNDALNFPVQGSSSEVTKTSLKLLKTRYEDEYLVSTIHDSNTLMQDEKDAQMWVDRLNECMIDAWYYVIKNTAIPDLPMPKEAEAKRRWEF